MNGPKRSPSEVLKRGYSDDELAHIYELARLCLENGDVRRAEAILVGINEIAPEYTAAWLGMAYVHIHNEQYDDAISCARTALEVSKDFVEAMLFMVACLLTVGDYTQAGTYLGEVGDRVDSGMVSDPKLVRFYQTQLARYQTRTV